MVGMLCGLFDLIYIRLPMMAPMRSPRRVPTFEERKPWPSEGSREETGAVRAFFGSR